MRLDLHLHSSASDGEDTPTDLMHRAHAEGVTHLALCDHDTLDGLTEASAAALDLGIHFIPAIELSVDHEETKLHMLVYFTDPEDLSLESRLEQLRSGRTRRNILIVDRLQALGYSVTMSDVEAQAAGRSVGRPHIADALVHAGHFADRGEVFADLLRDGGPAYVERDRLTAEEAIHLARAHGGVPVIAHPKTIIGTRDTYDTLFSDLADMGLGGIEAHHASHEPSLRAHLERKAASLRIAATGGSDYHGMTKREFRIGSGTGDLRVPHDAIDQLEAQRGR